MMMATRLCTKRILFIRYYLFLSIALCTMLSSCYRRESPTPDGFVPTEEQMDSISFYTTHHYSQNYNFIVVTDSLELTPTPAASESGRDAIVYKEDRLVVADIVMLPADTIDSVWVQVARDEETIGWTRESHLLTAVAPDNLISRFIDFFSDTHLLIMLGIVVVCIALLVASRLYRHHAHIVHFRDIDSFYPTLLTLLVSIAAVVYSSIQLFNPESWRHYYYHPSLNPFSLPEHLGIFVALVWAIAIVLLATLADVSHRLTTGEAILYFFGLAAICSVDYVLFSVSTLYYVGYLLLIAYIVFAIWRYFRFSRTRYICGNCGEHLRNKGRCPHCGIENV